MEEFAAEQKLSAAELRTRFAGSGLVECGEAHGAGQLTLTNDLITTAAHVFFDERGAPRAKTCFFSIENHASVETGWDAHGLPAVIMGCETEQASRPG